MGRFGVWRPVDRYQPGGSSFRPDFTARRLVLHTAVSSASSMHSYFNVSGRATPHFYVNRDGEVEQYIDTQHGSSANLDGNPDCITVESWDGYPDAFIGGQPPAWTLEQVEALARLAAWCHDRHDIPLQRLESSRPGTRGIGWHRLGIDGNFPDPPGGLLGGRVAGGEAWSESTGKVCPGDRKIRGVVDLIIPRAIEISNGDDMSAEDVQAIKEAVNANADRVINVIRNLAEAERTRDAKDADRDAELLVTLKALNTTGLTADEVKDLAVQAVTERLTS